MFYGKNVIVVGYSLEVTPQDALNDYLYNSWFYREINFGIMYMSEVATLYE